MPDRTAQHAAPIVKTRVVVVDDSALVRSMLRAIIDQQDDMECVGAAPDPLVAREMIRTLAPDVITLDVEMPRMDGLDFLERLMRLRPMPVVMVSTLTERGAETTLRALELGAIDFVAKPRIGVVDGLQGLATAVTEKIRVAAQARLFKPAPRSPGKTAPNTQATKATTPNTPTTLTTLTAPNTPPTPPRAAASLGRVSTEKIVCIGASTGGTEATRELLTCLPPDFPAVAITQHMPAGFTKSYAARLDGLCRIRVAEARDGERMLPGHAYIAPGGQHFSIERSGANYIARVQAGEPVNRHRPSVEVLFQSAARVAGPNALGVMLTGMGADGAEAMREMRDAGSYNVAQDEASCVVFGMPREAIAAGAVHDVLPLAQIAPKLLERLRCDAAQPHTRV